MGEVDKLIQSVTSKKIANTKELDGTDKQIETEFTENFQKLKDDIEHIDIRMQHINKFVVNLETQVNNIRALIANDDNPNKRGSYYTLMNTCMELNARYEDLYLKCIDLKFKYRKEQDDLNYKVKKMSYLEIPRLTKDTKDEAGELSAAKLSSLLQILAESLNKTDKKSDEVFDTINSLENDPDYKLT